MTFLIDVLAALRLTRLVTRDAITDPLRDAIEARSVEIASYSDNCPPEHRTYARDVQPWAFLRDMTDCGWCAGVWCAAGVTVARKVAPRAWSPVAYGLAVAALAGWQANRERTT